LGKALMASNPGCGGRWVRIKNGDVAVMFDRSKSRMTQLAMPITRVFKQIEHGEVYSIYSYFLSLHYTLEGRNDPNGAPSAPAPEMPKASTLGEMRLEPLAAKTKAGNSEEGEGGLPATAVQLGHDGNVLN